MFAMLDDGVVDETRISAMRCAKGNDGDIKTGMMTCNVRRDVYVNIFSQGFNIYLVYILLQ